MNLNTSYKQLSFSRMFEDIEAFADDGEVDGEKFKCGYSCYESGSEPEGENDVKKDFTRCAKDCPDDSGYNPKYKDCN